MKAHQPRSLRRGPGAAKPAKWPARGPSPWAALGPRPARAGAHTRAHTHSHSRAPAALRHRLTSRSARPAPSLPPAGPAGAQGWNHVGGGGGGSRPGSGRVSGRPGVSEPRGSRAHPNPRSASSSAAAASFPSSWLHSPSQPPRSRALPAQGSARRHSSAPAAGAGGDAGPGWGARGLREPLHLIRKRPHQQGGGGGDCQGPSPTLRPRTEHPARPFPRRPPPAPGSAQSPGRPGRWRGGNRAVPIPPGYRTHTRRPASAWRPPPPPRGTHARRPPVGKPGPPPRPGRLSPPPSGEEWKGEKRATRPSAAASPRDTRREEDKALGARRRTSSRRRGAPPPLSPPAPPARPGAPPLRAGAHPAPGRLVPAASAPREAGAGDGCLRPSPTAAGDQGPGPEGTVPSRFEKGAGSWGDEVIRAVTARRSRASPGPCTYLRGGGRGHGRVPPGPPGGLPESPRSFGARGGPSLQPGDPEPRRGDRFGVQLGKVSVVPAVSPRILTFPAGESQRPRDPPFYFRSSGNLLWALNSSAEAWTGDPRAPRSSRG